MDFDGFFKNAAKKIGGWVQGVDPDTKVSSGLKLPNTYEVPRSPPPCE